MDELIFAVQNISPMQLIQYGGFALVPVMIQYYAKKVSKYKEELDEKLAKIEMFEAGHAEVLEHLKELDKQVESLKKMVLERLDQYKDGGIVVLRDRLSQSLRYFLRIGYTNLYAKKNLMDLFTLYKQYGGNGVIEDMYYKYIQLPLVEEYSSCDIPSAQPTGVDEIIYSEIIGYSYGTDNEKDK